jgi:hypothetical protein
MLRRPRKPSDLLPNGGDNDTSNHYGGNHETIYDKDHNSRISWDTDHNCEYIPGSGHTIDQKTGRVTRWDPDIPWPKRN